MHKICEVCNLQFLGHFCWVQGNYVNQLFITGNFVFPAVDRKLVAVFFFNSWSLFQNKITLRCYIFSYTYPFHLKQVPDYLEIQCLLLSKSLCIWLKLIFWWRNSVGYRKISGGVLYNSHQCITAPGSEWMALLWGKEEL